MSKRVTFLWLIIAASPAGFSQVSAPDTVRTAVTYVSSGFVYMGAGSARGVAAGDTVLSRKSGSLLQIGTVSAISSRSSAARLLASQPAAVGDTVLILCRIPEQPVRAPLQMSRDTSRTDAGRMADKNASRLEPSAPPFMRGRVALQYSGAGAAGSAPDYGTSSLVFQLRSGASAGLVFSVMGRASYDAVLSTYALGSRFRLRMYEASIGFEDEAAWYGWTAGRVYSRFVSGLGQVDGVQAFVRRGGLTVGVVAGLQPDWRNSGVTFADQKGALFANAAFGGEQVHWDATLAYARQLNRGNLDRDFLYLQNTIRLASALYFYQSSEIDLHRMAAGVRTGAFRVTNTYASLTAMPLTWLSASVGYDATRPIYLFSTMQWLPDTLLDLSIRQGYRGSVTVRLPASIQLSSWGRLAPASGTQTRRTGMAGAGIRVADILRSGISLGTQVTTTRTLYTDGRSIALDADDWLTSSLSLQFHLERYRYALRFDGESHTATTAAASVNLRLSDQLYALASGEQFNDTGRTGRRFFLELGMRW